MGIKTVFDVATYDELLSLFGPEIDSPEETEDFLKKVRHYLEAEAGPDGNRAAFAHLYFNRGMKDKALKYIEMITDPELALQTSMLLFECHD